VTFSHSGELIATCSEDFTAHLWKRDGTPLGESMRHKGQVSWISFSDNDEWVVTGSWDETVRVWNAHTGLPITVPLKVGNMVEYVCFRGDRELFIANSLRNYVLRLPYFAGDIRSLLFEVPGPSEGEIQ
jgi:WD40 repeat protein